MVVKYFSFDGLEFETEQDCLDYEASIDNKAVLNVDFYDENGELYHVDSAKLYDDHVYCYAERIVIHNQEEFDAFQWLADYCGWCEFYDYITDVGEWKRRKRDDEYACLNEYEWVAVKQGYTEN